MKPVKKKIEAIKWLVELHGAEKTIHQNIPDLGEVQFDGDVPLVCVLDWYQADNRPDLDNHYKTVHPPKTLLEESENK